MARTLLILLISIFSLGSQAQELLPGQNPNHTISRSKYMKVADSLTLTQSTTTQETYKAIDYLADKKEARGNRRQERRDRRNNWVYNNGYYYDDYYGYGNNGYYRPYRNNNWTGPLLWSTVGSPFFWHWLSR